MNMVEQGKGYKIAMHERYVKCFLPILKKTKTLSSWTPCGSATTDHNQAFSIWLSFSDVSGGGSTYNYVGVEPWKHPFSPFLKS